MLNFRVKKNIYLSITKIFGFGQKSWVIPTSYFRTFSSYCLDKRRHFFWKKKKQEYLIISSKFKLAFRKKIVE